MDQHRQSETISLASERRSRLVVGVCAMEKKTSSKPMQEILMRLPKHIFQIEVFPEKMILDDPVEKWPICDCLIAFHSTGFPLHKAMEYEALRRPFVVNNLRKQTLLRDRRKVYEMLKKAGVPTPRYAAMSRDQVGGPEQTLEEFDDYVIVNGQTFNKPFVEKPVDADNHHIFIYYPMAAGGGSKRLFRKVDNKSSQYHANEHKVRRDGSYIYEEFVDTQGTDFKVYAVGPYYGHAEARKSPALDGVVQRGVDGKELRYPVILSWVEKDIAFKIYHAFKQTVCGFDILRTHNRTSLVCDVNGWSFVKKSRKYYDDCAALLSELMEHRRSLPQSRPPQRPPSSNTLTLDAAKESLGTPPKAALQAVASSTVGAAKPSAERSIASSFSEGTVTNAATKNQLPLSSARSLPNPAISSVAEQSQQQQQQEGSSRESSRSPRPGVGGSRNRELRCVIAVIRHGDRTPKRKLKVKIDHPKLVAVHTAHAKGSGKIAATQNEAKVRESRDLAEVARIVREIIEENNDKAADAKDTWFASLETIRDVLEQHTTLQGSAGVLGSNSALFSGCKLQLKPSKWTHEEGETTPKVTEVLLVLKWGGVLTELGVEHACKLGAHFRRHMYPASDDGAGLLRLHATFRHDLKIRTSDEGRVMKTGAAFTKGLLELEGDISPILVSLIHRGRSDVHMLDRAGNHEAQELLSQAKQHVERAFQVDISTRGDSDDEGEDSLSQAPKTKAALARRLIAPDGPASVLTALRKLENPRKALDRLYSLVDGLVLAFEPCVADGKEEKMLYMGETPRVWLDSWRDVRAELRRTSKGGQSTEQRYDLSKIPEIFDKVLFDAKHNAAKLDMEIVYPPFWELFALARTLSRAVAPLEFGGAADERRDVAWRVSRALIEKICFDLHTASMDPNAGLHFQLDDDPLHLADSQIKSSWRAVRSRLYFTSESHLHTLLSALRLPADRMASDVGDASLVEEGGCRWLSNIPDLSYLSHIVFRLWEDPNRDWNDPERHMVELLFSPGTKFECAMVDDLTLNPPPRPRHPAFKGIPSSDARSISARSIDVDNGEDKDSDDDEPAPTMPLQPFA